MVSACSYLAAIVAFLNDKKHRHLPVFFIKFRVQSSEFKVQIMCPPMADNSYLLDCFTTFAMTKELESLSLRASAATRGNPVSRCCAQHTKFALSVGTSAETDALLSML